MNQTDEFDANTTESKHSIIDQHFQWLFPVYSLVLITACFFNALHIIALLSTKKNGSLWLILQMAVVDLASFWVALAEPYTIYKSAWSLAPEWCPCFKGTEVLANTLIVYLLVCFNFHTISQLNLHETKAKSGNRNPLTSFTDESDECLVTKQENRTLTIDYSSRKSDISIIFPTILVWTVAISLSIPNYTLSSTFIMKTNESLCAVIDTYFGSLLQTSLLIFKTVIPIGLMFLSLILLWVKLMLSSTKEVDNVLAKKMEEIRKLIIFAVILTILYCLTSLQRHCFHVYHILFKKEDSFETPPIYNTLLSHTLNVLLSILHYTGGFFRSMLYLFLLPKYVQLVQVKILACCKTNK